MCVRVRVRGIGCRHLHEETWVNDVLSFVCVFVCLCSFLQQKPTMADDWREQPNDWLQRREASSSNLVAARLSAFTVRVCVVCLCVHVAHMLE